MEGMNKKGTKGVRKETQMRGKMTLDAGNGMKRRQMQE